MGFRRKQFRFRRGEVVVVVVVVVVVLRGEVDVTSSSVLRSLLSRKT